jgi:hypothetical protein
MVLDEYGEPLVLLIVGGTLGYRPGPEHPAHLQAKVVVQVPGSVLVNHKEPSP